MSRAHDPPTRLRRRSLLAAAAAALAGCSRKAASGPEPVRVAAASDLSAALGELAEAFRAKTGRSVVPVFGASGLLARQIAQGAPFDVFASANVAFVDELIASGHALADTRALYARGRLVLWTRKGASAHPSSLADLADPRFARVAIANPEHAPYGKAAREALTQAGVWDRLQGRLVFGENIQQTLQFARSGNADAALVAHSLAMAEDGDSVPVDEALHRPIEQAIVVTAQARDAAAARAFVAFVASAEGQAMLGRRGFAPPDASARP